LVPAKPRHRLGQSRAGDVFRLCVVPAQTITPDRHVPKLF
jgi:hypothetical protein